jgi:hypothetical protein
VIQILKAADYDFQKDLIEKSPERVFFREGQELTLKIKITDTFLSQILYRPDCIRGSELLGFEILEINMEDTSTKLNKLKEELFDLYNKY